MIVALCEQVLHLAGEARLDIDRAGRSRSGESILAAGSVDRSGKGRAASRHLIAPTHRYD
jgi:hypothetical protein